MGIIINNFSNKAEELGCKLIINVSRKKLGTAVLSTEVVTCDTQDGTTNGRFCL